MIPVNTRIFSTLLCALLLSAVSAEHNTDTSVGFQEGRHYHRISPAVATQAEPGSVEVLELFWYGCPHCFEFEKYLSRWEQEKPPGITFVRVPAVLNRSWLPHARAYYALQSIGEIDRLHPLFFQALHVQGRRLQDVASMSRFLSQHGVDAEAFRQAYNSDYVETEIQRASQLVRQYAARSVPTVIVNGKYRSTAGDAGGYERLLQLVNQLALQEAGVSAPATDKQASPD